MTDIVNLPQRVAVARPTLIAMLADHVSTYCDPADAQAGLDTLVAQLGLELTDTERAHLDEVVGRDDIEHADTSIVDTPVGRRRLALIVVAVALVIAAATVWWVAAVRLINALPNPALAVIVFAGVVLVLIDYARHDRAHR